MFSSFGVILLAFLLGALICWFVITYLGMGSRSLQIMKNRYQKLDESFEDLEKSFQKQDEVARTERKGLLDQIKEKDQSIQQLQFDKRSLIADAQDAETGFMSRITAINNKFELAVADNTALEEKTAKQLLQIAKLVEEIEMAKSRGDVAQSSDAEMKMLQHSMSRLQEMMEQEGIEYRKQIAKLTQQLEDALRNKPRFDDLTKISGIGPKLQEVLNDIGVTTFQQIAEAQSDVIKQIKEVLGTLSSRFERDEWVKQAQELMD